MPVERPDHQSSSPQDDTTGAQSSVSIISLPTSTAPLKTIDVGATIGPYKILQLLGEGGFGFVYLAEQSAPVQRKVALKILKLGMDTRQVIARFEAERQALAMMDHPNIAKVLDAGATETGRPYFVMELVRGIPITQYCDQHRLAAKERLVLFMLACNAVQHAHTKGIIHRDLKPSNILVTLQDGKPVPKVIDFGIAKAIEKKLTDKTVFTEFHQLIGTPEYMSPEQAEASSLDIDTRSDIYSLGVLLYELLTGTTPFDPRQLRAAGYGEIQRIIREVEPPKPSTRLTELITKGARTPTGGPQGAGTPGTWNQNPVDVNANIDAALAENLSAIGIARNRRVEPAGLRKLLCGDLDWITMKALEKDRTRRYETVSAFEMDVLKFLCDEAVSASPPRVSYRLWKFARRNRTLVLASAVVIVILLLGLITSTIFAIQTSIAYSKAEASRITAERERDAALLTRADLALAVASSNLDPIKIRVGTIEECLDLYSRLGHADQPNAAFAWHELTRYYLAKEDCAHARQCHDRCQRILNELPEARKNEVILSGFSLIRSDDRSTITTDNWSVQRLVERSTGLKSRVDELCGSAAPSDAD